jgi:septum formation protein
MMKLPHPKILLASASPRRLQILLAHGLSAEVVPAHIEEVLQTQETAEDYVCRLAKEKAQAVINKVDLNHFDVVLSADTIVAYQHHILEKPQTAEEAYEMLTMLSGEIHEVYTGYTLVFLPQLFWHIGFETTQISFHSLSDSQIQEYIASGDPFDKAGGYGIQQIHDKFVKEIRGSFYNVMGLPIEKILQLLHDKQG